MPEPDTAIQIKFAPLQGYTDKVYRRTYQRFFIGIDEFYSPYVCLNNQQVPDGLNDIIPKQDKLTPQVLPSNTKELELLLAKIQQLGYSKININMGCPYPMVTRKGRGSALISKPNLVNDLIKCAKGYGVEKLSLKMRLGLSSENEIFNLLSHLNFGMVDEIIIHPRTAEQLYKGKANVQIFKKCQINFPDFQFIYNGDIQTYDQFVQLKQDLNGINGIMLGRGLLMNPFLAEQIKQNLPVVSIEKKQKLVDFITDLFFEICKDSKDAGHALNRCKTQITYILSGDDSSKSSRRKIMKVKSLDELRAEIDNIKYA